MCLPFVDSGSAPAVPGQARFGGRSGLGNTASTGRSPLLRSSVLLGEDRDCSVSLGSETKSGTHDGELSLVVSWRPKRASHWMARDEGSTDPHVFRHVSKALDIDTNRRNPDSFERPLYMSN